MPVLSFFTTTPPDQWLAHIQAYLSRFDITIVHTDGKNNLLVDMVSRIIKYLGHPTTDSDFIPNSIIPTPLN